jgi:ABC-type transporter Mla maintaining outer membrane lipid asymmetry ATPase subunit MlaF
MNAVSTSVEPVIRMDRVALASMQDQNSVVVEDVTWTVQPGDYWVVAGLQGSGKTDFLMLTGGLMGPVRGDYFFYGQEMPIFEDSRLHERLRLGLVFESAQLFNHLTVSENIALPLRYHKNLTAGDAVAPVQAMLDATELGQWADSTPGALGRNWQRRVGLARALMLKPEILLLDNPLAGLDFRHLTWWLSFLSDLCHGHPLVDNRPLTLVTTTADLRPWKGYGREFAILKNRRFIVLGSWGQLEAARDELVRELLTTELSSA